MSELEIIKQLSSQLAPLATSMVGPIAGAIFTAIFLRNNTQTQEFEKLKAGKLQEVADDLLKSGKMTYTEYYKANNFLKVTQLADKEFNKEKSDFQDNISYDFDWFIRFYESVGNISNSTLQNFWAKLLADEIKHPTSYSFQTLDILKNLNHKDAILFTKINSHCITISQNIFLPNYITYLDAASITYNDIMHLDELGLINSNSLLALNVPLTPEKKVICNNNSLLITIDSLKLSEIQITQYPLTSSGSQLSKMLSTMPSNEDIISFAKELMEDTNINISIHKVNYIKDGYINYKLQDITENYFHKF